MFELGGVTVPQIAGLVIVFAAMGHAVVVLLSRVKQYRNQLTRYEQARESFDEQILTQRIRRADRERESHSWSGYRKFRLERKVDEGGGICSFYLEPHDRKPIPSYRPGQYLTFQSKMRDISKPVVRCYSLSDAPAPRGFRVTIKKLLPPRNQAGAPPGLVSSYFHNELVEGSLVDVKAPTGKFYLDMSQNSPVTLIAGGVGLTPLLSMLNAVAQAGFGREVRFFYGVRNTDEHIFKEHLLGLARDFENRLRLDVCYSQLAEDALPKGGPAHYHAGIVSVDLLKRLLPSNNYEFYVCGPPPMMTAIIGGLSDWGVPDSKIHHEAFGPASVPEPKATAAVGDLTVTFDRSGKTVAWDPGFESLLECAEQCGVVIDSGCRAGNCGSCVTAIKSGEVQYRRDPGEEPDVGTCLTCISVPKANLVLDA